MSDAVPVSVVGNAKPRAYLIMAEGIDMLLRPEQHARFVAEGWIKSAHAIPLFTESDILGCLIETLKEDIRA